MTDSKSLVLEAMKKAGKSLKTGILLTGQKRGRQGDERV
jgi:hypothetical protein